MCKLALRKKVVINEIMKDVVITVCFSFFRVGLVLVAFADDGLLKILRRRC